VNTTNDSDKRKFDRVPVNMDVCFFANDSRHFGSIVNFSADGIYIQTSIPASISPELHIILPFKNRLLNVPFIIVRMKKRNNTANGIGLRIQSESKKYLEFAISHSLGLPD
jgi:hypothetical protein